MTLCTWCLVEPSAGKHQASECCDNCRGLTPKERANTWQRAVKAAAAKRGTRPASTPKAS